ncbi:MAG: TonB-dependent receptor, partial [Phycisphaeraceae bacterium]|nr:TonB-dependent receptor [Phycisphaeraceae bacterium]
LSRYLFAGLTSTLLALPSNAQTDQTTEQAPPSQQVIVTATRIDTPQSQVGSSVSVIDSQQMQNRQDQDIADALQHTPGVHVRRAGGLGSQASIFIRGAESDHTLMLLDGIKIHDLASPGGTATFDHLTTTGLDRIEVLRGPQSTLYGTEAIGGVISATTKRGSGDLNGYYSVETGSYKTTTQKLHLNGGDDDFNYSISTVRTDADIFSSAADNGESDPYRNTSFHSLFGLTLFDAFNIDIAFHYINADIEFDNNGADDQTDQTDFEQYALKVEPTFYFLDGLWESKLSLTLNQTSRLTTGTNFTVANSGFNFTFLPNGFDGRALEADWQNTLLINDNNTLVFGIAYSDERGEFSDPGVANQVYTTHSYSLYLQHQLQVTDNLTINGGLRYINHDQFGSNITYQLAGAYHFAPTNTILRASIGTGFKAPSIADLFDNGNPNLNAEESIGWDIGIEQPLLNDKLTAGATFFQNTLNDMIFYDNTSFQIINVGKARTQGVETYLQYKPADDLIATLNYTYTDSEVLNPQGTFGPQKGARLWRRPLHSYGFDLTKKFMDNQANITFSMVGASQRDDNGGKADAYVICNLASSCKITDNIEVFARVENIFNEQYQDLRGFNTADASGYAGVKISF